VHGGLVSPGEANPDYRDIVLNFQAGKAFLLEEFNVTTTIGWQLDPFGHSAVTPLLFSEMGLDTVVFARINDKEREERRLNQTMQFIWQPDFDFTKNVTEIKNESGSAIFAHLLHDHYNVQGIFLDY